MSPLFFSFHFIRSTYSFHVPLIPQQLRLADRPLIDNSLTSLEFDRVLTLVALEARTTLGRESVMQRSPSHTLRDCEKGQSELFEMVRVIHQEGSLPFGGITDVRPLLERDSLLELEESWQVLRAVRGTQALRELFLRSAQPPPLLTQTAERIPDFSELIGAVGRYFNADGKLREEASPRLRSIRSQVQQKRRVIQKTLNDLMNRQADAIQEPLITLRGDRYCIPVRADHRNSVPGILHERSGSGASFFIEPMQVVEVNNDLADLLIDEREEVARITREIAQALVDHAGEIRASLQIAGELDAIQACAVIYDVMDATRPRFTEDRHLRLVEARHPLLDERLADHRRKAFGEERDATVVSVSFELTGDSHALLISGPNAGGKTVTLKTAGLLVAMASAGLPVPASEGTLIPVVDSCHVLIGDDQNVLEHLSTFSGYLTRLRVVLERATSRSLVLLDELGSGTDPEEGSAIAAATIEHLLNTGPLMVVTTHLTALKSFAISDPRIVNASMQFDSASARPTFRMALGVPGRSRAIEVAEMVGLPKSIVEGARARLGEHYGDLDALIGELQLRLGETLAEREAMQSLRAEAEKDRLEAARLREEIESERKKVARTVRDEVNRLKDEVTSRLRTEVKKLREADSKARQSSTLTDEAYQRAIEPLASAEAWTPSTRPVRVGDRVEHRRFKLTGELISIDDRRAKIRAGGKQIEVDVADLIPVETTKPSEPVKKKRVASTVDPDEREPEISAELNLVGQRVEDALEESDKFLDRALLDGKGAVRLIHGFGTGKLRAAIREQLRKHRGVRSFRRGDEREGGDGATVAILDV